MGQKFAFKGFGIAAVMVLTGCSGAPSCGDQEVLQLITEIYEDILRDRYAATGIYSVNYDDVVRSANADPSFQVVVDEIEEDVRNSRIDISAVRTLSSNNSISQSVCACSIAISYFQGRAYGEEVHSRVSVMNINFEYTAQYSDDGAELYVQGYEI